MGKVCDHKRAVRLLNKKTGSIDVGCKDCGKVKYEFSGDWKRVLIKDRKNYATH